MFYKGGGLLIDGESPVKDEQDAIRNGSKTYYKFTGWGNKNRFIFYVGTKEGADKAYKTGDGRFKINGHKVELIKP